LIHVIRGSQPQQLSLSVFLENIKPWSRHRDLRRFPPYRLRLGMGGKN
jgi:hypothetical protein